MAQQLRAAVVLGGGAPNAALMAGALCGIYDSGKTFNEFYTSGAGAMIGLTYLAGKAANPHEALYGLLEAGVDDAIYNWVRLGYKTFFKSGPFVVPFKKFGDQFKLQASGVNPGFERFYNDLVDLAVAVVTPTDLTPHSQALCGHYPFLREAVDFVKLKAFNGKFYMNAYCVETGQVEEFPNKDIPWIGPEHFDAAISFPFIYPPTRIGDKHYYEGAAHSPLNLPRSHRRGRKNKIDFLAIFDILGVFKKALIRVPKDLLDAYGISILLPVVTMADKDLHSFTKFHRRQQRKALLAGRRGDLYEHQVLNFHVDPNDYPSLCDWSYSNQHHLWEVGYQAGLAFCARHHHKLPDHVQDSPDPV